jgi:protein gp37
MSEISDIEWTDSTWNPIIGCTRVRRGKDVPSGCDNCYADDQVARFEKRYDRLTTIKLGATKRGTLTFVPKNPKTGKTLGHGAQWTGALWLLPDVLELPLRRRKPTTYFVNSLSDWAHESIVKSEHGRRFLAAMFGVMAACPQHTFQLLTKRPEQARTWFGWVNGERDYWDSLVDAIIDPLRDPDGSDRLRQAAMRFDGCDDCPQGDLLLAWPLPNVWLGASVEDSTTKTRIDDLRTLPAGVRFLSIEPILEDVGELDLRDIDWVIVGGESGAKARPCDIEWIRSVVRQCKAAGVPAFCKQLGARSTILVTDPKGGDMAEWPEDLRVREMPRAT